MPPETEPLTTQPVPAETNPTVLPPAPENPLETQETVLDQAAFSLLSQENEEETQAPADAESGPTEPPSEGTPPSLPELPDTPDIPLPPVDPNRFAGILTYEKIDPLVSTYSALPMVTDSAQVMSIKMMEATAVQAVMDRLAGMDQVFTRFLQDSFFVDTNRLTGAFQFNMDEEQIQRLFEALMNGQEARSASSNLKKLGYADLDSPFTMNVYFKDFDSKEVFLEFLEDYNTDMRESDQEGKVIRYTDMTGRMMDSVRIIINSVSYVLIAFVGVSLVVSSIMIGIITYISVMERTREIGVLRAMGASKHNISQVFNAETFIIGLCSGLIGIGITLALLVPGNQLLLKFTGNVQITAQLPWVGAVILILLSMVLTLIGGLIPSRQAAKKDPVIALRSE